MKIILIILGVSIILLGAVCIYNLWNNHYVYSQFKAFNENIKKWSEEIDNNTRDAINRQAMLILQEMDSKITDLNNNDNNLDENESESDEAQ